MGLGINVYTLCEKAQHYLVSHKKLFVNIISMGVATWDLYTNSCVTMHTLFKQLIIWADMICNKKK